MTTGFLLIILYLFNNTAYVDQQVYPTLEACKAGGEAKAREILLDGNKLILEGGCIKVPVVTVSRKP